MSARCGCANGTNPPIPRRQPRQRVRELPTVCLLAQVETTGGLAADPHWAKAVSRLSEMQIGLGRIRDLVVRLRTFSRLDEGEWKPSSMKETVESVLTILRHRFEERIQVTTSFGEPDLVDCSPGPLAQAIMNLVSNAIDAIEGDGAVTVSTGAEGDCYRIAVSDTGRGVSEAISDRIFEPFFTTKSVGQGMGLGLSISYSIAKRHGGEIDIFPRKGGGTTASIRFPLRR
jgi:two-component system NtrC family sensor kinase